MKVTRRFTKAGQDPFSSVEYDRRTSRISNPDGSTGPSQGHFYNDPRSGETLKARDAYTFSQPHACFIQSVKDDLVGAGGIMDLWVREARLFKYGSGTGSNFSNLRGENEKLSG